MYPSILSSHCKLLNPITVRKIISHLIIYRQLMIKAVRFSALRSFYICSPDGYSESVFMRIPGEIVSLRSADGSKNNVKRSSAWSVHERAIIIGLRPLLGTPFNCLGRGFSPPESKWNIIHKNMCIKCTLRALLYGDWHHAIFLWDAIAIHTFTKKSIRLFYGFRAHKCTNNYKSEV